MRSDAIYLCVCVFTLCVLINCTISVMEFEQSIPDDTPIILESRTLSESVVHAESPKTAVPCSTEYLAYSESTYFSSPMYLGQSEI